MEGLLTLVSPVITKIASSLASPREKPSSILEIHGGKTREAFECLGSKIEHTDVQAKIRLLETGTVVACEIDRVWFDTKRTYG